jgi:hypothetical protein
MAKPRSLTLPFLVWAMFDLPLGPRTRNLCTPPVRQAGATID